MLTPEQLAERQFDLANSIAHQKMEGLNVDEKFLYEITRIMESVGDDEVTEALADLKQRVIRGEIF